MEHAINHLERFRNQVIQGDSLKLLKELPENSIDLIFADPPYNLQLSNQLFRPDQSKVSGVEAQWDKFSDFESYDQFTTTWLRECQRVLKPSGTLWTIGSYHNIFRVGYAMQNLGYWILNDVIWLKSNPMPNFAGVRMTNAHETLIWAKKNEKAKGYQFNAKVLKQFNNGKQLRSDWYIADEDQIKPEAFEISLCTGKERIKDENGIKAHPTQKPIALLHRIILGCSKEGDIVLDPFCGAGTTAYVARQMKRDFITFDLDENYVEVAKKRLSSITPTIFP